MAAGAGLLGSLRAIRAEEGGEPRGPERWEAAIQAFVAQDAADPPEPGGLLFLGSSSIRLWDLEESFPGRPAVNRGFGGSRIPDSIHWFDRLVMPHAPSTVVFYAGENDIAEGRTPLEVFESFTRFAALLDERLPDCRLVFIALKPSRARWHLWPEMRRANDMIFGFCAAHPRLEFVDVAVPMLAAGATGTAPDEGDDTGGGAEEPGPPPAPLFVADDLHLSAEGYGLWTDLVEAALRDDAAGR